MKVCLICDSEEGHLTLLTPRGLKSIKDYANIQNNENVKNKIKKKWNFHIHKDCQKQFTNKRRINQKLTKLEDNITKVTRSSAAAFCWKNQCFFVT